MPIIKNPLTIVQSISATNKLPQVIDRTITNITAEDLKGITSVGQYAFAQCNQLTNVVIPNGVTTIGDYAFYNCTNLITMRVEAPTPPTLSSTNAISTATTQIQVPMASVDAYKTATNWTQYANIIVGYEEEV